METPGPARNPPIARNIPVTHYMVFNSQYQLWPLIDQRGASTRTAESYRDAVELLFDFIITRRDTRPEDLNVNDLYADLVNEFLHYPETEGGNSVRTRNARLVAVHSFMRHVGSGASPGAAEKCWPSPVSVSTTLCSATSPREQISAILAAPAPNVDR